MKLFKTLQLDSGHLGEFEFRPNFKTAAITFSEMTLIDSLIALLNPKDLFKNNCFGKQKYKL